jgi:hypothetical protein
MNAFRPTILDFLENFKLQIIRLIEVSVLSITLITTILLVTLIALITLALMPNGSGYSVVVEGIRTWSVAVCSVCARTACVPPAVNTIKKRKCNKWNHSINNDGKKRCASHKVT